MLGRTDSHCLSQDIGNSGIGAQAVPPAGI